MITVFLLFISLIGGDAYLQPHLNRKFNSLQHQQLTSSVPQFGRFIVIRSARQKGNSSDKGNLHQKRDISRRSKGLFLPIESKILEPNMAPRESVRSSYSPRFFHGGLFAPGLMLPTPRRPFLFPLAKTRESFTSCQNPTSVYLSLGQRCWQQKRRKITKKRNTPQYSFGNERFSRTRIKNLRPDFPKIKHQNFSKRESRGESRRESRRESRGEYSRRKRGPGCMKRCLEMRILHPAQCHSLC